MIEDVLKRHDKIALQFSGGKDSIACLYLLRPYWNRMTVYWLNSGDPYPETVELMREVAAMVPHFVEVPGEVRLVHSVIGMPTDVIPIHLTPFGQSAIGGNLKYTDRYTCCFLSIMQPMHKRMEEDGITLLIRGQKASDKHKSTLQSGDVSDGFEMLFPLEEWSDADVLKYLHECDAPIPRYYQEGLKSAPDCMCCSAWWEEGKAAYIKRHHPERYTEYMKKLDFLHSEIQLQLSYLEAERS